MRLLHKLILKSYIGPFIATFFISAFVLLMQFLWQWIEDLIGKGLHWTTISEIMFYASAGVVPMALPLAVLLASVMTFGNLGEHYELTAMKSSGVSLMKIMKPLIIFNLLISIGAFFFSNNTLPYTNLKMAQLLYDVQRKTPELNIKEGVFNYDIKGYSIKIENKSDNMMYGFMIYNHTKNKKNSEVTIADSGRIYITDDKSQMVVDLYSGYSYNEIQENDRKKKDEKPFRKEKFDEQTIIFDLVDNDLKSSPISLWKNNYNMMNISQLYQVIDSLNIALDQKTPKLQKNLLDVHYFKNEKKIHNPKAYELIRKDSLQKYKKVKNLIVTTDFDSVYNNMDDKSKGAVMGNAANRARTTLSEISAAAKNLESKHKWKRRHELALYRKFSLSFACLIFFFIGAPLGAIIRKGGFGFPLLVSVLLFIIYYVLSITGEKLVKEDIIPVLIGSWLSSAVLFPAGIFITYKASRDSTLLDITKYSLFLKKIANLVSKRKIRKLQTIK